MDVVKRSVAFLLLKWMATFLRAATTEIYGALVGCIFYVAESENGCAVFTMAVRIVEFIRASPFVY